jgi:hypothetical protein
MKVFLTFLFLFSISKYSFANDSQYLIKEMESLRDSLQLEDPARIDLTLRLADLYFDVSIQEGKGEDLEALKKNRLKALDLYKRSLEGTDHLKKATGLNRVKIQFQMGRLLSRLNEGKMAEQYYLDILGNTESPKKMMEQSALALAEWHEDEANYAQAKKYYDRAISHCSDRNSCNYGNYRLAWLYYKDTKLDEAILTMEKSLWTEESVIRESSLTDLILFLSNKEKSDGTRELEMIQKISAKAHRPELTRLLVEAFYVAGNRLAGSNLLAEINKLDPNLYYEVRLLEEYYGFRKWEKVQQYLSIIEKRKITDLPSKPEEAKEVMVILRRFIVQVDAEMQVVADLKSVLKRSIESYLTLYPKDELRAKMQSGWLAIVLDKKEKLAKLDQWIKEDISLKISPIETRKLRQTRLAMAQSEKLPKIVIEDSLAIADILKGTPEADEFLYVASREQYAQKSFDLALPHFQTIVKNAKGQKVIGNWAILSQNLILDIYNTQKNYDGIVSQVSFWKEITKGVSSDEVIKETKSMDQILVQAQFEKAFLLKESPVALESFYQFCLNDQYIEKSCPNAKVLSIKFKSQEKLVKILEKMGEQNELASELELMGRFQEAALVREKFELAGKPNVEAYLKTAFLYELDHNLKERNRILSLMVIALKNEKSLPSEFEKIAYTSLFEANLLNELALAMPWSVGFKLKIASQLQVENPTALTKQVLFSTKEGSGPVWSKVVLSELETEYKKTNLIKFYGTQSQKLFKKRTAAIEKFASLAKPMLDSADLETRIYILHMLKLTYKNMANEILNTPIPDGLDEKTLASVTTQISSMADPFDRVNEDYDKLLGEQLAALANENLKAIVAKNISGAAENYASFIQLNGSEKVERKVVGSIDYNQAVSMRKNLLINPEDKKTLLGLKEFYTKNQNSRIAAYYAERVDNLKQVE